VANKPKKDLLTSPETYEIAILKDRLKMVEAALSEMQNSTFWRATRPLRNLVEQTRNTVHKSPRLTRFINRFVFAHPAHTIDDRNGGEKISPKSSLEEIKIKQKKKLEAELNHFFLTDDILHLPVSDKPKVSIILVLYNQAALTFRCLRSLSLESLVPFEVIIFDNNSQDETTEMIKKISGTTYMFSPHNVGFLKAVNQAAGAASGEHLLLLNNDAVLLPGTLGNAVSRLESHEKFGAVGGKIILLDGSLQEAGSIVWQDGSCLGYGREQDPDDPEFQFLRTVDYCSGAFLLVKRRLFEELGRFDEDYSPAYYEESDFCLKLAESGYQVVYDPGVEILHYEFGSSSSADHALALQKRNREKFIEKHQDTLRNKRICSQLGILKSRDLTRYKGRVLYIEDRVPHESFGAGYPRCRTIVQSLIELGMFVTFYPLLFSQEDWESTYQTLPQYVEVMLGHGIEGLQDFLDKRTGYYDYLLVSRPHNMKIVKILFKNHPRLFQGIKIIYDAEAIFSLREIRAQEVLGNFYSPRKFQKKFEEELNLADIAQTIITVSAEEAAHFAHAGYSNIHVLSHSFLPEPTPAGFDERQGLLFVGFLDHDNSPNVDSILWFMKEIMPKIEEEHDPPTLTVVGSAESRQLQDLKSDHLLITGQVDSLKPFFNKTRVFIVPTRFAAGIPYKAHEAASHGVPMVTTSLIARQLGWKHQTDLLAEDAPAQFANCIMQLYNNPVLWQKLRQNALDKINQECSKAGFMENLMAIFQLKL
jgi:O-antigen biosynthesis protein